MFSLVVWNCLHYMYPRRNYLSTFLEKISNKDMYKKISKIYISRFAKTTYNLE
jgi:hypothetical protein